MRSSGPRHRGSITVFLCLLLTWILGFVGACLEYSRAQAVSCQVQLAVDAGAESIFAGFHAPLNSRYQILGRLVPGGDFEGIGKETLRYIQAYDGQQKDLSGGRNFVTFQSENASWSEVSFLTDQNGHIFTHLAAEAMLYSGVRILTGEWQERLGIGDSEKDAIYRENNGKNPQQGSDYLSGYSDWSQNLEEASREAEEEARRQDEERQQEQEENEDSEEDTPREPDDRSQRELEEKRREGAHFLEMVENLRTLMDRGILAVVLPEGKEVSTGTITKSGLPSGLSASQKGRCISGGEVSGGNALLFREYIVRNLDCFTAGAKKSVAYELEYVIGGKDSDLRNLEAVLGKLLLTRTSLNMIYLNQSALRRTEAMEAATLAVGWTCQPELVTLTTYLFLTAWALAEAVVDIRSLLNGKKVVLVKTDENWQLQFANLAEECLTKETEGDERGMSYEDYLRIFLYLMADETAAYRTMDVVQWNIAKLDSDFTMDNCMVAGTLHISAVTTSIFNVLYHKMGRMKPLTFEKKSSFSYIS